MALIGLPLSSLVYFLLLVALIMSNHLVTLNIHQLLLVFHYKSRLCPLTFSASLPSSGMPRI